MERQTTKYKRKQLRKILPKGTSTSNYKRIANFGAPAIIQSTSETERKRRDAALRRMSHEDAERNELLDYDRKARIVGGTLYLVGNIVCVLWDSPELYGDFGRETWTCESVEQAEKSFRELRSRWQKARVNRKARKLLSPQAEAMDFIARLHKDKSYVVIVRKILDVSPHLSLKRAREMAQMEAV